MRFIGLVGPLLLVVGVRAAPVPAQHEPVHFQIQLNRAGNAWTAQCDTGCSWRALSVSCSANCLLVIDADGVSTNVTTPRGAVQFAFVLRGTTDGWEARSVTGTTWRTLGWHSTGCMFGSCRASLDERGVSGL